MQSFNKVPCYLLRYKNVFNRIVVLIFLKFGILILMKNRGIQWLNHLESLIKGLKSVGRGRGRLGKQYLSLKMWEVKHFHH